MAWTASFASAQTVGAVGLAVYLADAFAMTDRWWVALSAFAVLHDNFALSVKRCTERLAGTAIGAATAVAISIVTKVGPPNWLPPAQRLLGIMIGLAGLALVMLGHRD